MGMQFVPGSRNLPEWADTRRGTVVIARDRDEVASILTTASECAGRTGVAYRYPAMGRGGYVLFYFEDKARLQAFEDAVYG